MEKNQNLWKLIILYLSSTIKFCISGWNTNYNEILVKSSIGITYTQSIIYFVSL